MVVVYGKADVVSGEQDAKLESLLKDYLQIETGVQASAKTLKNVQQVFFMAQRSAMFPLSPLLTPKSTRADNDGNDDVFGDKALAALKRIYAIIDLDGDGLLSPAELNAFQVFNQKTNNFQCQCYFYRNGALGVSLQTKTLPHSCNPSETIVLLD